MIRETRADAVPAGGGQAVRGAAVRCDLQPVAGDQRDDARSGTGVGGGGAVRRRPARPRARPRPWRAQPRWRASKPPSSPEVASVWPTPGSRSSVPGPSRRPASRPRPGSRCRRCRLRAGLGGAHLGKPRDSHQDETRERGNSGARGGNTRDMTVSDDRLGLADPARNLTPRHDSLSPCAVAPPTGADDLPRYLRATAARADADDLVTAHANCGVAIAAAARWKLRARPRRRTVAAYLGDPAARPAGRARPGRRDRERAAGTATGAGRPPTRRHCCWPGGSPSAGHGATWPAPRNCWPAGGELPEGGGSLALRYARGRLYAATDRPGEGLADLFFCGERLAARQADRPGRAALAVLGGRDSGRDRHRGGGRPAGRGRGATGPAIGPGVGARPGAAVEGMVPGAAGCPPCSRRCRCSSARRAGSNTPRPWSTSAGAERGPPPSAGPPGAARGPRGGRGVRLAGLGRAGPHRLRRGRRQDPCRGPARLRAGSVPRDLGLVVGSK